MKALARLPEAAPFPDMASIPGGIFSMGSNAHYPEEAPTHKVRVGAFWMDKYAVTNTEFRRFVDATGYVTLAERPADPANYPGAKLELLVPSSAVFSRPRSRVDMANAYNWWIYMPGANWRHPRGPLSSLQGLWKHPVVHVAFEDADAYARWAGKSLPTEAEWEFAARGGLSQHPFPWGDQPATSRPEYASRWLTGPEPVGASAPNGYGLFDMCENVHEWCSDWYDPRYYDYAPSENPHGPESGTRKASRGGAWRHHIRIARCAARSSIPPEFRYADYGFRIAADA